MKVVMRTPFGSKLYGTATPESDTDFKGIFLPEANDILLGKAPKSIQMNTNNSSAKNTASDIDEEYFSLQYFLEMAIKGETIAIDMLHAPLNQIELDPKYGWIWEFIHKNRSKFYTTDMKAYLGYVRKQAAKYGIKGGRLSAVQKVLEWAKTLPRSVPVDLDESGARIKNAVLIDGVMHCEARIGQFFNTAPIDGEYCTIISNVGQIRCLQLCSSSYQETLSVNQFVKNVQKMYDNYGERARQAANNENIDWKSLQHACRGGLQLLEIYTTNDLKYPLQNASLLKDIKSGKITFSKVQEYLEDLVDKVDLHSKLAAEQGLPNKVDRTLWDDFVINQYTRIVNGG